MIKIIFIIFSLLFLDFTYSNESGGSEAKDAKPAEGKGEAKSSRSEIFAKHEQELIVQHGRILSTETHIRELIEEKNKTNDKVKLKEVVEEIKKGLIERKEAITKYNKEFYFIKYELPGRGKNFDRKYKRFDEKKQKSFEDEVNKALSDVLGKMNEKYNQ